MPVPELADGADVLLRPLPAPDELELAAAPDEDEELWADAVAACADAGRA